MTSAEHNSAVSATPTYAIFSSDTSASLTSVVNDVLAVNSSEAVSLGGKKAKTPIIAGSICGGVMGLAWIIGFAIYFRKRYQRKQRKRLAALGVPVPPKEKEAKDSSEERIIIPPDPAVLLGQHKPGEFAFLQPSYLDKHQGKTYHKDYHSAHATLSDTPYSAATAESSTGSQPILSKDTFNEKQSLGGDHNV